MAGDRVEPLRIEPLEKVGAGRWSVALMRGDDVLAQDSFTLTTSKGKDKLIHWAEDYSDGSPVDRDQLVAMVDQFVVEEARAKSQRGAGRETADDGQQDPARSLAAFDEQVDRLIARTDQDVCDEVDRLLEAPDLLDVVLRDIEHLGVVGERELSLSLYLIGTSRLLEKPLSAIVQGSTSTGKSFVAERVGRLFPDEVVIRAHDLSAKSLYYFEFGRLQHRFVIAGERSRVQNDETAEATKALREMRSDGELRKGVTVKARDDSGFRTQEIYQPGPIAFVET